MAQQIHFGKNQDIKVKSWDTKSFGINRIYFWDGNFLNLLSRSGK